MIWTKRESFTVSGDIFFSSTQQPNQLTTPNQITLPMFSRIPFHRVNWKTSSFLIGTLFLTLFAVPLYLWRFGLDWFQAVFFFAMFVATGLSITLGYHRLFAHLSFKANWSVRLFTLIFGAAAFEN